MEERMPQSLINEFITHRKDGNGVRKSLKEAVFQAKNDDMEFDDDDLEYGEKKFKLFKVKMRGLVDSDPVDWWFASTAIPLFAATFGPLANVLSIAALITSWRLSLVNTDDPTTPLTQLTANTIPDPHWCYIINALSLAMGFAGNLFLILNFGNRVRYIISLPMSIISWILAAALLTADLITINERLPPNFPNEIYSGGYWYGLEAAVVYLMLAVALLVNMIGYIRGHYHQHFELTKDQRTLVVQTMMYFFWMAGGAGIFCAVEGFTYADSLYFAAVTILTVGYGDMYPLTDLGRGLIIPFSFGGLIVLGLVISSIFRAIKEIGEQNVIHHHYEKIRSRTLGRTVTTSLELERKEVERELVRERAMAKAALKSSSRSPHTLLHRQTTFDQFSFHKTMSGHASRQSLSSRPGSIMSTASRTSSFTTAMKKKHHILILKEEKDRFNQMRKIQHKSDVWNRWVRLAISFTAFAIFWVVGAAVFWQLEQETLDMTYWQSVYYGWVTLITIGYGDFSPHSVAGRSFFVVWVQFAVPALTVLADNLSLTVVEVFNSSTANIASTILPRAETLQSLQVKYPYFFSKLPYSIQKKILNRDAAARVLRGFEIGMDDIPGEDAPNMTEDDAFAAGVVSPDVSALEEQHRRDLRKAPDAGALARQLALAIKRCALDMHGDQPKQYAFEEWVEFTRLIRFTAIGGAKEAMKEEENEGMVQWDWLAENSPLMSEQKEAEFVLDRLCESLVRYLRRNPPHAPFADAVREKGEEALRLRSGGWNEDEIAEAHEKMGTKTTSGEDPERRGSQSLFSRIMDRNLQPVVEEENDIRPVRPS